MSSTSTLLLFVIFFTLALLGICQHDEPYIVTPSSSCGFSKSPRVVGGINASPGEFPWMASILLHGNHYCGGTIIANHWIITAAHCVHRHNKNVLKIRVGGHKLSERSDQEHDLAIQKIIIHPNFVLARYLNDLALLRLVDDIVWDDNKSPICFPKSSDDNCVGREATVAGWGWTKEPALGGSRSNVLQKLVVKIADRKECQNWYHQAGKYITIDSNHMCAGYKEGAKDSCDGDSGGPLMLKDGSQYRLIGVVSAGIGCARPLLPGLYTIVRNYLSWIQDIISD